VAIAYQSESTASDNTVNVPSGTVDGDLLVAVLGDGGSEFTAPSGWTTVDSYEVYPAATDWSWVGYIIVSGTPPSSYTWGGGTGTTRAVIQRFSGVGSYGGSAAQSNTNSTTLTCPSVTPDQDNSLVVFTGAGFHQDSQTNPSGYSNVYSSSVASGVPEVYIASLVQGTASATGSVNSTGWYALSDFTQRGVHLWFREAGGGSESVAVVTSLSLSLDIQNFVHMFGRDSVRRRGL